MSIKLYSNIYLYAYLFLIYVSIKMKKKILRRLIFNKWWSFENRTKDSSVSIILAPQSHKNKDSRKNIIVLRRLILIKSWYI